MKTFTITAALSLLSFATFAQICPGSFKRNNGNGTCGSLGELRLYFPGTAPGEYPLIDSVFTDGVKSGVQFNAPDGAHLGGNNGYLSYCVSSGNMPPANVWTIFFHVNGGAGYACTVLGGASGGPLAVKYHSFDASVNNHSVNCTWVTEEEINNNYFELERSFDGISYSTIAVIFAAENNTGVAQHYQYQDNATALFNQDQVYYRIKQVDKDGTAAYSKIVSIKMKAANAAAKLQTMPNPFMESITVKVTAGESGLATASMINANGQTVASTQTGVVKGLNSFSITKLHALPKGIYVVHVSINGVVKGNQKIVKN